ncbi:endonuclease/exonuclease/phosphatase family protein [Paludisphaera mucosa]|uniref:Endonuclease/exonuclease/phosphatase family protein n=1 Tax=Paludisphaera mucosa TaxID=3030827 RepID=A0ABT6FBI0_9BACT|nr:endonuclease/exonuclease/phosphatase family protein [Paludisphaera mucosa]MDG3004892.1 endonuclease/exonuclease/phosphatase family protein [Paludisphaera mucosa]
MPLLPLGIAATAFALAHRGGSARWPRYVLAALGLAAIVGSGSTMIGRGPTSSSTPPAAPGGEVRLLHWNVLWGGRPRTDASWRSIEDAILRDAPDVVVLSEAPPDARLESLQGRLGAGWSRTQVGHDPGDPYWFKLVALSRWPVASGRTVLIRNGTAMDVRVERPGRPIRLLVVDGRSKITQLRTPMLLDVADACRAAFAAGDPYDVVAGDFNAVSRSIGFDALRSAAGGYEPASASSTGWRGTWPMPSPVYDIDHVWVNAAWRVAACSLFANLACDHRGQLVRLTPPRPPADGSVDAPQPPAGLVAEPDRAAVRGPKMARGTHASSRRPGFTTRRAASGP